MALTESFEKTITADKIERWRYPRFFTENIADTATVNGDDAKHISTVLRMKVGDRAVLCDNSENDYLCEIISAQKEQVIFSILDKQKNEAEPTVRLRLFQCVPKSDKMEFIVQKATELGASEIIPVLSKRCVSRPDEKTAAKKAIRYQKIAEEAAKQCGRGKIPEIKPMISFKEAIKAYSGDGCGILFYECGGETISKIVSENPSVINVFIGSEGGFEKEEAELAHDNGIALATLGKRILRCETAPVAALSVLMNLTGNL